jgi:hypothetical protein
MELVLLFFHPEASESPFLASGGKQGLAIHFFSWEGVGTFVSPLLVVLISNIHIRFAIVAVIS